MREWRPLNTLVSLNCETTRPSYSEIPDSWGVYALRNVLCKQYQGTQILILYNLRELNYKKTFTLLMVPSQMKGPYRADERNGELF